MSLTMSTGPAVAGILAVAVLLLIAIVARIAVLVREDRPAAVPPAEPSPLEDIFPTVPQPAAGTLMTRAEAARTLTDAGVPDCSERTLRRHPDRLGLDWRKPVGGRSWMVTTASVRRVLASRPAAGAADEGTSPAPLLLRVADAPGPAARPFPVDARPGSHPRQEAPQ